MTVGRLEEGRLLVLRQQRAESAVWPFGAEPQWEQRTVEDGVPAGSS